MMTRVVPYLLIFLLPLSVLMAAQGAGWQFLLPVLIAHFMLPVFDHLIGRRLDNVPKDQEKDAQQTGIYSWILWAYVPVQVGLTAWVILQVPDLQGWAFWGMMLALGVNNGAMGINIAHELVHRQNRLEPRLGRILLLCVCYTHWAVEHVRGHHKNVATAADPATSRRGQSLYAFWIQSLTGTIGSAWGIECDRLRKESKPVFSLQNDVLVWWGFQSIVIAAVFWLSGWLGVAFFMGQALIAVLELENVNYIEHYGLQRRKLETGRFEPVQPRHSWNADYRLTGWFLIELGRHSDHHANAMRRYQTLRTFPDVPQMPTGYGGMVMLAMIPPLWFRVMDPHLQAWQRMYGDPDNIQQSA